MATYRAFRVGIVASSFAFHFIIVGLLLSFGILYSELHEEFSVKQVHAAWMTSLFSGIIGIAGIPIGHHVTRFGERKLAVMGSILLFLGILTSSFVTSFALFYVTYGLLAGVGASLCMIPSTIILMKTFTKGRPLAVAIGTSGSAFGNLALPPLLTYMIDQYGWRGTFLLLSGLALQGLPASLLLVSTEEDGNPLETNSNRATANQKSFKAATRVVCKNTKFTIFASSTIALFLVIFAPVTFLPDLMKELSMTDREIYIVIMVMGVGHLLGRLSPGGLQNCFRLDLLTMFASVLFSGAMASTVIFFVHSFIGLIVLSLMIGFITGASICLHILIAAHLLDRDTNDIGFGWMSTLNGTAVLVGIPLAGLMVDVSDTVKTAYPYTGGFMFLSMILVLVTKFSIYFRAEEKERRLRSDGLHH